MPGKVICQCYRGIHTLTSYDWPSFHHSATREAGDSDWLLRREAD